jgi:hypothetical protein
VARYGAIFFLKMKIISNKEIIKSLRVVRNLRDFYSKNSVSFGSPCCVNTEELVDICERHVGKKIAMFTGDYSARSGRANFASMYVRGESVDSIWLSPRLDRRELRYAVAKELMHVVLSDPEYGSLEIAATADSYIEYYQQHGVRPGLLLAGNADTLFDSNLTKPAMAEGLARVAAMEFHFPYAARASHQDLPDEDVAALYDLPVALIAKFRSPAMMNNLAAAHESAS